jgi:hypothetical protein
VSYFELSEHLFWTINYFMREFMKVNDSLKLSAVVWRDDKSYFASCADFDVKCQGESVGAVLNSLKKELERFVGHGNVDIVNVQIASSMRHLKWLKHFSQGSQ